MIACRHRYFKPFVEEAKLKEKLKNLKAELAATKDPQEKAALEALITQNLEKQDVVEKKIFRK